MGGLDQAALFESVPLGELCDVIYTVITEGADSDDRDRIDEAVWSTDVSSNDRRAFAYQYGEVR